MGFLKTAHYNIPDELERYFVDGCKEKSDLKVGVEWEKIGVYRKTGRAIRYSGPKGVEAIFKALCRRYRWTPVFSGSHMIALRKKDSSITLEPGGQIELSGWKASALNENAAELYSHLEEIKEVSSSMGIAWLGIGAQPISTAAEIEWVPKPRYRIMRESLREKGELTYSMMKETASVQISIDYTSEPDAARKLRLAMGLAPILSAMFANSPLERGKFSGYLSRRAYIWLHTAPERTGIIPSVFSRDFSFRAYTDYALDAPLLFIVRREKWLPIKGLTFRQFLKKGYNGCTPDSEDWELHLTSIFTEARLKKYIEIRCLDCQKTELGLSAVALLKGIFYDERSSRQAWELVSNLRFEERERLRRISPSKGLEAPFQKRTLLHTAKDLLRIAERGLERLASGKIAAFPDETRYLGPLKELIFEEAANPAELLLRQLGLERSRSKKAGIEEILKFAAI